MNTIVDAALGAGVALNGYVFFYVHGGTVINLIIAIACLIGLLHQVMTSEQ